MNDEFLNTLQAYMVGVDPALAQFFKPAGSNGRNETKEEENTRVPGGAGPARLEAPGTNPGSIQPGRIGPA